MTVDKRVMAVSMTVGSQLRHYAVAVLSVTIALLLTLLLGHLVAQAVVVLFLAAVAVSSWYGGVKTGLVTVILSALACDYFLIPPLYSLGGTTASIVQLVEFILVALLICFSMGRLRLTTDRLSRMNKALEAEIQERIKTMDALAASETELQQLLAAMTDTIVVFDANGRFLKFKQNAELNYRPGIERIGKTVYEILPQDVADLLINAIQSTLTKYRQLLRQTSVVADHLSEATTTVEYSLTIQNRQTWLSTTISPLSDNTVLCVARNITRLKEAEAGIRESERKLRLHNQTLAELAKHQAISDGELDIAFNLITEKAANALEVERVSIWLLNDDRTKLQCLDLYERSKHQHTAGTERNRADYPIYFQALATNRTIAVTDTEIDPRVQEFRDSLLKPLNIVSLIDAPVVIAGEVVGMVFHEHVETQRHWELTEQSFVGSISDFVALTLEVYDRKRTQQELYAAKEAAEAANRAKSTFLANMSHELRTPLNSVLGITEALQDEICGSLNDEQHKFLKTLEKSGKHLLELINDVLDLAKVESGKMEIQFAPTSIKNLCESSLTLIRQQAFNKKIQLNLHIPEDAGSINVDRRRIQQVLINLLGNAVKFTPEGNEVWIEVQPDPANQQMHFSVVDTGIGISPENLSKLFQPFMQVESSYTRRYAGTGLGLALVRRIVEMHNGDIKVESEVGRGSRFIVTLPWRVEEWRSGGVEEQETGEPSSHTLTPSHPHTPTPLPPSLILLAEDNEANVLTITRYLDAQGFQLVLANNGVEAFEMAKLHTPDLILMDVQMPEMDGLEATRRIRANPDIAHIPVIALTSFAMAIDREQCLAAGMDEFITKPVVLKELTQVIASYLSQKPQKG